MQWNQEGYLHAVRVGKLSGLAIGDLSILRKRLQGKDV